MKTNRNTDVSFIMCALWIIVFVVAITGMVHAQPSGGKEPGFTKPYDFKNLLARGEELYRNNNFKDALIFYYEALNEVQNSEVKSRLHFRIGECLEGIRRFDFAEYHYKSAIVGKLSEPLAARVAEKLKHLPALAQQEEAMRLFNRAMSAYNKRDIRGAIDDYLNSLRLQPSLMAKDESGLIDDAIQYLTYLTESKDKEPERLLKLATLLELRGETEKAVETLKQILIIYPSSEEAAEAEEKVNFYTAKRTSYLEFQKPRDALSEILPPQDPVIIQTDLEFTDPGIVSKELPECAYTVRASNEQPNVPAGRFENFSVILGRGADQREFFFSADDGISEKMLAYEDGNICYNVKLREVELTTGYIRDIYGEGVRPAPLFSRIRMNITVTRK